MSDIDFERVRAEWRMPEELRAGLLPRDVRFRWGTRLFLVGLTGFTVLMFVLAVSAYGRYLENARDRREGVASTAVITSHWTSRAKHKKARTQYHVSYRYVVAGVGYSGYARVSSGEYRAAPNGTAVPIHVDATSPGISHMDKAAVEPSLWVPIILLFAGFGGPLIAGLLLNERKVMAMGTAVPAIVTRGPRVHSGAVRYEYQGLVGIISATGLMPKGGAKEGDIITALYHPDKPYRPIAYPSRSVRVGGGE